ncbi:IPT/TIG domain-containing protein, partial [Jatrophihabitans sp.]|uniref:IPT/TIG domain-containing protein n=1 Tax=Jatrophihabitans sp. TaxID=1932789 RepID=UPI002B5D4C1F|nr:IPT/TIG domain-containing protein [Jatrophihabitans sp.]
MSPRRPVARLRDAAVLIVVAGLVLNFESPATSAPLPLPAAGSVTYSYDALGRLVGASEPGVGSVTHSYDAAGNLTATTPSTGTGPQLLSVTPQHATPGSTVTIRGANFSSTPSNDQVSFGAATAAVSSAAPGSLIVTVPSGAVSGPVTVTVGGVTATGPSFTVDPPGQAPTITGLSASQVGLGGILTISGSHFDPNPARDVVQINQTRAPVTAASASSLTVTVPQNAVGSGKVTLSTPAGSATSTADLYVLPAGLAASTLDTGQRVTLPGAVTLATSGSGHVALAVFDASANSHLFVQEGTSSVPSCNGTLAIYDPHGVTIGSDSCAATNNYLDQLLPTAGSYTVALSTNGSGGSLPITLNLVVDSTSPITTDGTPKTVTTGIGQSANLTFTATAGQRVYVSITGNTARATSCAIVTLLNPSRTSTASTSACSASAYIDTTTLTEAGSYTLVFNPGGTDTGSATVAVYTVPADAVVPVNADGSSHTVSTALGQAADFTFPATAGQRVLVGLSGGSYPNCFSALLRNPAGAQLNTVWFCGAATYIDSTTLPAAGSYSVHLDPYGTDAGSVSVAIYTVAADSSTAVNADGSSHTVTTSLGQNADLTFTATAGQRVFVNVSGGSYPTCFSVLLRNPAGAQLNAVWFCGAATYIDTTALPAAGSYSVHIDPYGTDAGSMSVAVYTVAADSSTAVNADGSSHTVTTSLGQSADLTFTGAAGQKVFVNVSGGSYPNCFSIILRNPAGTQLNYVWYCGGSAIIDTTALPAAGTYSVHIDPSGTDTGSVSVAIKPVAADLNVPVSADGSSHTVTTSLGQVADFTFTGSAGQKVFVNVSSGSYPNCFSIILRNPVGTQLNYVWYCGGSATIDTTTLAAAGTYSVHIDPSGTDTGSVSVAVSTIVTDFSIPVSADGSSNTVTTVSGQNADLTFTGAAGQKVFVNLSGGSYPHCFTINLRNPAGTQLNYVWYCGGANFIDTTTLPAAGTYSLHIDPPGTDTGSVTVAINTVAADASTAVNADGIAHTATTSLGQVADLTFTGAAGQKVFVNLSGGSYPHCFTINLRNPAGTQLNYVWYCGGANFI